MGSVRPKTRGGGVVRAAADVIHILAPKGRLAMANPLRPRYLAWAGPGNYRECCSLAEALLAAKETGGTVYEPLAMSAIEKIAAEETVEPPAPKPVLDRPNVCRGMGGSASGPACCERAGEYNGYGGPERLFTCPKSCPCHD